jgi:hypothetical protein
MTIEHLLYGQKAPRHIETVNSMTFGEAALVTGYAVHAIADLRTKNKVMCPGDTSRVFVARYVADDNSRAFGLIQSGSTGDMPTID